MGKVMMTLQLDPKEADLPHVRSKLGLKKDEIDEQFGIVNISPKEHLYCVLLEEETAARVSGLDWVKGPYSNPKIETFGPPKAEPDQDAR
jgi:hypothetical protein